MESRLPPARPIAQAALAHPFALASILARTLGLWKKNFALLSAAVLVLEAPLRIARRALIATGHQAWTDPVILAVSLLEFLCGLLLIAVLTLAAVRFMTTERVHLAEVVSNAVGRMWGLLIVFVSIGICTMLWSVPIAVVVTLWRDVFGSNPSLSIAAGYVAVTPVLSVLSLAVPAVVVEQRGAVWALKQSRDLTKGHRFALAACLMVYFGLEFGLQRLVASALAAGVTPLTESHWFVPGC